MNGKALKLGFKVLGAATMFGFSLVFLRIYADMFTHEKVTVSEPNLTIRWIEIVLLTVALVYSGSLLYGMVQSNALG